MNLQTAFLHQAEHCARLGSNFMDRFCRLSAAHLAPGIPVFDRLLDWPGDLSPIGQSIPLRLAGALHGLVLEGRAPELAAVYPPNTATDAELWTQIKAACLRHEAQVMVWLDSPPQTNEVRRASALITAATLLRTKTGLPLVVSELGASAGLNLSFDRFAMQAGGRVYGTADSPVQLAPDWTGPLPLLEPIEITQRAGVDLQPIDAQAPDGALRLLAYLWPDQPERIARTRAAIGLSDTVPDQSDAVDWLETRLRTPHPGAVHLIYHTIAWQYFPEAVQARGEAVLAAAGAKATPEAPLARLSMEADNQSPGAALHMTLWDGGPRSGAVIPLGRIDFHGQWLHLTQAEI